MATLDESYNGYKNWHTWNTALWINNDENTSNYFDHLARHYPSRFEHDVRLFIAVLKNNGQDLIDPDLVDFEEVRESVIIE